MRESPDGRDVVDMLVPIVGSRSRTVIISGLGLPTKIGIGAVDLPNETWLEIENRFPGPNFLLYDTVETLHGGMVALDDDPIRGHDQVYVARSGATFGMGLLKEPHPKLGQIREGSESGEDMAAWVVTSGSGKALLVAPYRCDSFEVRDRIAKGMMGEFTVEMVTSGTMHAAADLAVRGWTAVKEHSYAVTPKLRM